MTRVASMEVDVGVGSNIKAVMRNPEAFYEL